MRVIKCDLCKEKIKDNKLITVGVGFLTHVELCEKCANPIISFLKKHKFIALKRAKGKYPWD